MKTLDAIIVIIQTQAAVVNQCKQKKGVATILARKRENDMGVYIKGMEMPGRCGHCPCFNAENPIYCQAVKADRSKRIAAPYGLPRPDWCPLVEVSDDGVLISEDEFRTYSRAILVAFTLRDLLDNLNDFTEVQKSIEPVANAPADNEAEDEHGSI